MSKVWGIETSISPHDIADYQGFKLFYGRQKDSSSASVLPRNNLLFEQDIHPFSEEWNASQNCLQWFCMDAGVDYFAAIFFHLTRYEEYLPTKLDSLGRYDYKNSVAFKNQCLEQPLVDIYLAKIAAIIQSHHPNFKPKKPNNLMLPTMDIDIAFDYKGRSISRTVGAYLKDVSQLNFSRIIERTQVLIGLKKDKAFIFNKLNVEKILFFVHVGKNGKLDKSCGLKTKEYQTFLQALSKANIGIHPSFQSHLDKDEIVKEKQKLEAISKKNIAKSRQHYIKMILPETYEMLVAIGIKEDYSMGWPQISGFRAGTTQIHYFFNLKRNEVSDLLLFPFVWMDGHFLFGDNKSQQTSEDKFLYYQQQFAEYGGVFTPIFHNNHFSNSQIGQILYRLISQK